MPVITPAYPSMCATFNITRSSMTIIQRELKRGIDLTEKIMAEKLPWSELFTKHTFFTKSYKHYICVISASRTEEAHKLWSGYVESKVRVLVQKLEGHDKITLAQAFNKSYPRRHKCRSADEIQAVENGKLDYLAPPEDNEPKAEVNGGVAPQQNGIDAQQEERSIVEDKDKVKREPAEDSNGIAAPEASGSGTKPGEPSNAGVQSEDAEAVKGAEEEAGAMAAPTANTPIDIYTTTHYIGLELVEKPGNLDLSYQINDFKSFCFQWTSIKRSSKTRSRSAYSTPRSKSFPDLPRRFFAHASRRLQS